MAKDPAFLFYVSDFLTGTMLMTNEQVGIYIRLLCIQHQHGGIIDTASFENIVKDHQIIRTKFKKKRQGFYNPRMLDEMLKRKKKSNNLSINALKRWNKGKEQKQCKSNAIASKKHMPIKDKDENEDESNSDSLLTNKKPYTVTKDKDVDIKVKATDSGNGGSAISKQERKKAAAVLFGREEWITERPVSLAKAFEKQGYPLNTTLAFIIQAKDKNNAPGWLTTVLSDAKYSPSDEAHERSKKAMRSAL